MPEAALADRALCAVLVLEDEAGDVAVGDGVMTLGSARHKQSISQGLGVNQKRVKHAQ